jgi:hypothetical protein
LAAPGLLAAGPEQASGARRPSVHQVVVELQYVQTLAPELAGARLSGHLSANGQASETDGPNFLLLVQILAAGGALAAARASQRYPQPLRAPDSAPAWPVARGIELRDRRDSVTGAPALASGQQTDHFRPGAKDFRTA